MYSGKFNSALLEAAQHRHNLSLTHTVQERTAQYEIICTRDVIIVDPQGIGTSNLENLPRNFDLAKIFVNQVGHPHVLLHQGRFVGPFAIVTAKIRAVLQEELDVLLTPRSRLMQSDRDSCALHRALRGTSTASSTCG